MNDKQRRVIAERQRAAAATMAAASGPGVDPEPEGPPPEPQRPFEEIVAEQRPAVGDGIPVAFIRFSDRTFQLPGMQSGEVLTAKRSPVGIGHTIEFMPRLNAFLVTYVNPIKRTVEFDVVERSAVKRWRIAPSPVGDP